MTEEDIKILKSIPNPEQPLDIEIQIAIEHLLNRLEQDERVIEEMGECFFRYKSHFLSLEEYNNEKQIIDHFRKKCE